MLLKIIVLLSICVVINAFSSYDCKHKMGRDLSNTKCVAGRRFFARLDKTPTFRRIFSKEILVKSYAFPWIAQVISNYAGTSNLCGGVLINDRFVLTAQQCCSPPLKLEDLEVSLGYMDKIDSNCVVQSRVLNIILHPDYYSNTEKSRNNIALLEVQPVTYTETIYPVQLPSKLDQHMNLTNQLLESAGYQKNQISFLNQFDTSVMKVMSNDECSNYDVSYKQAVNSDTICCNNIENIQSMCTTPAPGTPLMIEKNYSIYNVTILLGIASLNGATNPACTGQKPPIVYVRIDKKLPWILENTADAFYCNN